MGFRHDPSAPLRQDIYLRALRTLPDLVIHDGGWFASHATLLPQYPLAYIPENQQPPTRPPQLVQVMRLEEKRTDVDIATHLLMDGFSGRFDEAIVMSNDGDLALPVKMVRDEFHKRIGVVNPHNSTRISGGLINASTYHMRSINKKILAESQFPPELSDAKGTFRKPSSW